MVNCKKTKDNLFFLDIPFACNHRYITVYSHKEYAIF